MKDSSGMKGMVRMVCHSADGSLKWDTGWFPNGITNAGKAQMALLAGDAAGVPFTFLGVGTSATAFSAGQTALGAEITTNGFARIAATVSLVTTTTTNDTRRMVRTFTATGGTTLIEEVGFFNAISAGTMGGRALTGTKSMTTNDVLVVTYDLIFT